MTREEAINLLGWLKSKTNREDDLEAIDMAIEALQADVVRCENCIQKHIGGSVTQYYWCDKWDREVDCNNGCSWGERKGGDDE